MNEKVYPKTITLKKSIINIAVIFSMLILFLILHNLYQASHHANYDQNEPAVQSIASTNDTHWYKDEIVKNTVAESPKEIITTVDTNNSVVPQSQQQESISVPNPEVVKAMSAPITSNQLTGESATSSSNMTASSPLATNNPTLSTDDPNMQAQKKAFIQEQSNLQNDYLTSTLQNPISQFILQAGTIIPGVLLTGINSDLPGQITGQVRSNVYDSISGRYLLIPQGAKLIGLYDSQIAYGQERVLVVWKRITFPNGQSINLQGMPGVDMSGYAGFNDLVDNHYGKIFGSVILMSTLSAGAQLSQPQNNDNPFQAPTVGQTMAQSLGTNLSNTGTMITSKNLNIQPTLKIRQGYEFNISVTKDIVFPSAYEN
jgi:type IV secretory pathway VirB10-like protein